MPELGETWSVADSASGKRSEAVVIATGPTMIRLVGRSGRRLTFPTGSWSGIWQFVHAPPAPPQTCHQCPQTAYFRFIGWDGTPVWTCEDHLPHGVLAHFPGDLPTANARFEMRCPRCAGPQVTQSPSPLVLPNQRSTTNFVCGACSARWSPLISRGLGDDGAILAADLHQMIETDAAISEIWIGFVAHRNLCRALSMGNVPHVHGVPIHMRVDLGDLLTLVFSKTESPSDDVGDALLYAVQAVRPGRFAFGFQPIDIRVSSRWMRRSNSSGRGVFCIVLAVEGDTVRFGVPGRIGDCFESRKDFLTHWTPNARQATDRPRETSIWKHQETDHLVQVIEATTTQMANSQIPYVLFGGQRETTPLATFYRLYREIPTPPEDHIWCRERQLFEVERKDRLSLVRPCPSWEAATITEPQEIESATLYSLYEPLVFIDGVACLRGGTWWSSPASPENVLIVDLGTLWGDSMTFVRFSRAGVVHIREASSFRAEYTYCPPKSACEVGETWISREHPDRQGLILKNIEPDCEWVTLRWNDGVEDTLSHDDLVASYRRLDVRTYWEMLDIGDDP